MEMEKCINFLLSKSQNLVLSYFKEQLSSYGITPVQYGVLKCLWDEEHLSPGKIAQRLYLDSSTITGILDRVEDKNFIKREPHPEDRRSLQIVLTDKGRDIQTDLEKEIIKANKYVLKKLKNKEQVRLKKYLELISQQLQED